MSDEEQGLPRGQPLSPSKSPSPALLPGLNRYPNNSHSRTIPEGLAFFTNPDKAMGQRLYEGGYTAYNSKEKKAIGVYHKAGRKEETDISLTIEGAEHWHIPLGSTGRRGNNAALTKWGFFILRKMAAQCARGNFKDRKIEITWKEAVNAGMFTRTDTASRSFKNVATYLQRIRISFIGNVWKGNKLVRSATPASIVLFPTVFLGVGGEETKRPHGFTIRVNNDLDAAELMKFTMLVPDYDLSLSVSGLFALHRICSALRYSVEAIAQTGHISLTYDDLRIAMHLAAPDTKSAPEHTSVSDSIYRDIGKPMIDSLQELRQKEEEAAKAGNQSFTLDLTALELYEKGKITLAELLKKKMAITPSPRYRDSLQSIAENKQEAIERNAARKAARMKKATE